MISLRMHNLITVSVSQRIISGQCDVSQMFMGGRDISCPSVIPDSDVTNISDNQTCIRS